MSLSPAQKTIRTGLIWLGLVLGCTSFYFGYIYWLGLAFAAGLTIVWSVFVLLLSIQQPSRTTSFLGGFVHLVVSVMAFGGLRYILPSTELAEVPFLSSVGFAASGILFLFLASRYLEGLSNSNGALLRVSFWNWFIGLLGLVSLQYGWRSFHVEASLLQFALLLVISGEGGLRFVFWRTSLFRGKEQFFSIVPRWLLGLFFSRLNPIASFFDVLQRFFGIDLAGTWAILFVRRAFEPLLFALVFLAWLSTSVVLIHPSESGIRSSFGRVEATVLPSGIHVKLPWPMGEIRRAQSHRVLSMEIGHEGDDEDAEEESILWANQHADEEFTLLLGEGNNVISMDGTLHYQISDLHTYLYGHQNPEQQLRVVAYQVLMHETASRTLAQALRENLSDLAVTVGQKIQTQCEQQQLGLRVVSFRFSALHPPVAVAADYQNVISAQIDVQTQKIRSDLDHFERTSRAKIERNVTVNFAQAQAEKKQATARGEAASFDALRAQVRTAQDLYEFRRRTEALEKQLKGRRLIIIDDKIEKQGGTLWIQD